MTSEILLSKDSINMKSHNKHHVSVLKPYLFVLVCLLNKYDFIGTSKFVFSVVVVVFFFEKVNLPNPGAAYSTIQM